MTSIVPPQHTEHEDSPTSELVIAARAAVDEFSSKLASESRLTDERQVLDSLFTFSPYLQPLGASWAWNMDSEKVN